MWDSAREIPEVVLLGISDEAFAVLVDGSDARSAIKNDGPFIGSVPVKFANTAGCKSHVHTRQALRDRKLAYCDFARPSTFVHPLVGKREWILKVRDQTFGV